MSAEWEWVDGYDNTTYSDDRIFEIDPDTKQIAQVTGQPIISGEELSQFIRFQMPRYYDGVDLSTKTIQIIYLTGSDDYSDINMAVCVERNDEYIRFGWIIPAAACYEAGVLTFGIEAVGTDYVWKSRAYELEIYDGLNGGKIIPEPTDKAWYIELQERCDYVLDQATNAKEAAAGSAAGAANIKTAVDGTKTLIDAALEQIGVNKTDIATLVARMDQALSDYDASAETEIMDARVGHNGTTYNTLGAAIRGQFDELRLYVDSDGYVCQSEST